MVFETGWNANGRCFWQVDIFFPPADLGTEPAMKEKSEVVKGDTPAPAHSRVFPHENLLPAAQFPDKAETLPCVGANRRSHR